MNQDQCKEAAEHLWPQQCHCMDGLFVGRRHKIYMHLRVMLTAAVRVAGAIGVSGGPGAPEGGGRVPAGPAASVGRLSEHRQGWRCRAAAAAWQGDLRSCPPVYAADISAMHVMESTSS